MRPHVVILCSVVAFPPLTAEPLLSSQQTGIGAADPADFADHVAVMGVNAALGGITAGLFRALNHGSFVEGFVQGVLGGGLVYAGKRIAGGQFAGAGLLGRELASVGNSIVFNAADGRGAFDRLLVPLGPLPVRLIVSPGARRPVWPKVDLVSFASLTFGLVSSARSLDIGESLSSGAAVFRVKEEQIAPGRTPLPVANTDGVRQGTTVGGTIFLNERSMGDPITLAHERIHVIQFDFVLAAWSDRSDSWLVPRVDRYVKVNSVAATMGLVNQTFFLPDERENLPWEFEARFFSER